MKILMVCLGNICRSPLADALMRKKVKERGLEIIVDSAGTSSFHLGHAPDIRTQENAKKHNLDMSFLRARQFVKSDFQEFDRIYVMDRNNAYNVLELAETEADRAKVFLLLDVLEDSTRTEVPDPYYGGEKGFEKVYQLLDLATDKIIQQISTSKL